MNTLAKEMTATFYKDATGYDTLVERWAKMAAEKQPLSSAEHALYAVLRGKDWRKGFTPISNRKKLENGAAYDSEITKLNVRLFSDWNLVIFAVFADLLSDTAIMHIRELLNKNLHETSANALPEEAYDEGQLMAVFGQDIVSAAAEAKATRAQRKNRQVVLHA